MKRREAVEAIPGSQTNVVDISGNSEAPEALKENDNSMVKEAEERLFFIEEGKPHDIPANHCTSSILYRMEESFEVERRFVKPGDSAGIVYEGKKPSRKTTLPILVLRSGEHVVLSSWDELDQQPERLADVREVIGAAQVKQIFVLRKR